MMDTLYYVSGPRSHKWSGVCEVLNGRQYIHHFDWPERSHHISEFLNEPWTQLVAGGYWVPYYPDLEIDEGL